MNETGRWYRVSFRLMGDGLDCDSVTHALGLEASHIGRKGEHIDNNPARGIETNIWVLRSQDDPSSPFEDQIEEVLTVLEPKGRELDEILVRTDCEGELFLGYSSMNGQGGGSISTKTLSRIAALGLSIDLDLYPPPPDAD